MHLTRAQGHALYHITYPMLTVLHYTLVSLRRHLSLHYGLHHVRSDQTLPSGPSLPPPLPLTPTPTHTCHHPDCLVCTQTTPLVAGLGVAAAAYAGRAALLAFQSFKASPPRLRQFYKVRHVVTTARHPLRQCKAAAELVVM